MKNIVLIVALLAFSFGNAQAFVGEGDQKFQVGANIQDYATGINVSFDHGLGENISVGVSSSYALGGSSWIENLDFEDRFDLKARFNANLGNVINVDENFDFYPGLNLSLKNFGGHVGARYFFSPGFGLYTEANFPLAKYDKDSIDIHNQFTLNLGMTFNL
ncbi:DUF6646 family protein [Winogradskyella endarachnes]|uniref:Outer membrane beta-barrel protein n=1 Tax=Winogradskyella endarachnes TaxID=2681965 RepID=A0A6L6UC22_9FLAO|nr:DUF6646 family protein [Winogradskyella endarachnes]MUU78492.1 hypothetical protein [Winogradskyella endarachnes]